MVFFAIHRVVNVVIAPNAMIGEWHNCFEREEEGGREREGSVMQVLSCLSHVLRI